MPIPLENLLLLKADYIGSTSVNNFELVEGRHAILEFSKEDVCNYGDFCFVDFTCADDIAGLNGEQIAELLYLGHMFKPLKSPLFEALQNRIAYLAHDDGFYCKIYCKNYDDFISVLFNKIIANIDIVACQPSDLIRGELLQLSTKGILIDLNEISYRDESVKINIYQIGEHSNMDNIQNNHREIKGTASKIFTFHYNGKEWSIS